MDGDQPFGLVRDGAVCVTKGEAACRPMTAAGVKAHLQEVRRPLQEVRRPRR